MGLEPSVDQGKVTKTRERIDCGFYDDPEILNVLMDCCIDALMREVNRSAAQETRAHVIPALPIGRAHRVQVRPMGRNRCAAAMGR
jgi:hypothetical protein